MGLDGGKMLLRIDDTDPGSNQTMVACADAVGALAAERLVAMVELSRRRSGWEGQVVDDPDLLVEAVAVASALGPVSAYTWLKLPHRPSRNGCWQRPACPVSFSAVTRVSGPRS